ncbi:MAG: hypothetical protein CME38_01280 [Haliea sp.]|nr:hypothetical protein [Haliea sp.]|tara:strand:+ start:3398 stop:3760 length:363 start_codon:yes stop_codon:yes gene_type:complete
MGKSITPAVLDAQLAAAEGDAVHVCNAEPTSYLEANDTYNLAQTALVPGDFTKAAGDVNGRKNTLAAKTGVTIDASGTATHVAISNGTDLIRVTTCDSQALTVGGTVDIGSHAHEIADPT